MAKYNFIDDIGLKEVLTKIHNFYASKAELEAAIAQVNAEVQGIDTNAQTRDDNLSTRLTGEETRAKNRETELNSSIENEARQRIEADSKVRTDLTAALNTSIEGLSADLTQQIVTLNGRVSALIGTEQGHYNELDTRLVQEVNDRITALAAQKTEIDGLLTALEARVNALVDETDQAARGDFQTDLAAAKAELDATDRLLAQAIYDEGANRRTQDAYITERIDNFNLPKLKSDLQAFIIAQLDDFRAQGIKSIIKVPELSSEGGQLDLLYVVESVSGPTLHQWTGSQWKQLAVQNDIVRIDEDINSLEADLAGEIDTRTSLSQTVSDHGTTLAQHTLEISNLDASVVQLESAVSEDTSGLRTDIDALREDLGDAQEDIEELQGLVEEGTGTLRLDLNELQADFQSEQARMGTKTDNIIIRVAGLEDTAETLNTSIMGVSGELNAHTHNKENPHAVTAAQIGLDKVNNTSDMEKPVSVAMATALDAKVNIADIKDTLSSTASDFALSAKQGSVLKGMIQDAQADMETRITALGNTFHFKGTVAAVADLPTASDDPAPEQGDCWQIKDPSDPDAQNTGAMYSWTGSAWTQVVASVVDISTYAMTLNEVYSIIDNFIPE